jgi:hypothetical protein
LPLNTKAGTYVIKLFNETMNYTSRVIVEWLRIYWTNKHHNIYLKLSILFGWIKR